MNNLDKITLEKCLEIVKESKSFFVKEEMINNQKVYQFSYGYASFKDFVDPIKGSGIEAFELRGITFVEQENGEFKRYLLLKKFFNLNETNGNNGRNSYLKKDLEKYDIINIDNKLDGSLIRFIPFNNNIVLAKTKMAFESEMAKMAQEIYDKNQNYIDFINELHSNNLMAAWELISPKNQIVLKYNKNELRLIKIRNEKTGEYIDIHDNHLVKKYNIPKVKEIEIKSLDWFIEKRLEFKGIEGWVLLFSNNQMVKLKTKEYLELHKILSPETIKEDDIISSVLNNTIDDVISQLIESASDNKDIKDILDKKREWIEEITLKVQNYINDKSKELNNIVDKEFNGNKQEMAEKYKSDEYFKSIMKLTSNNSLEISQNMVKNHIKRNYLKYSKAKEWIKTLK